MRNASIKTRAHRIPAALHLIRMTKMFMGDVDSHFHFLEKHTEKEKNMMPGQLECLQTGL